MSTNIPFTLVEGAVALPPLRPLGPLSQTLGREWALLPPNVSLRVELKALYAAMLRTFCLSSQAIRSMCRWEPLSAQNDASDAGDAGLATAAGAWSQRDSAAATVHASSHAAGVAGSFAATAGVKPGARPLPHTPRRASNLTAGSAVAISGAAMLAWIVLDHPHREYVNSAAPAAIGPASSRAAQHAEPSKTVAIASVDQAGHAGSGGNLSTDLNRSANVEETRVVQAATVTNPQPVASPQVVVASQPPSSGVVQAATPASGTATVASGERPITQNVAVKAVTAPASTTSIAPVAATSAEAASRQAATVAARRSSTAAATSNATTTAATWSARHAAASAETTVSRAASASAKPSAAGNYSPFAPSATVDGEYESVTASARTFSSDSPYGTTTANNAVQQRTQAMPRSNVDTNDTSWMGRLSQRRVTEVPELFSQ